MLQRALQSLQAQIYLNWHADVYDDSSTTASREVVENLGDSRVSYSRNPRRLGAVSNVDQCFSPMAIRGGDYGCLLEDDNFWFPNFLSSIVTQLQQRFWNIIQTNQRLCEKNGELHPANETTRGGWFPAGRVELIDLRATLLLIEGVSNSGLVWKLNQKTDLRIGDSVPEAGLNEACRSLLVGEPFLFIEEPLGAYTIIQKSESARADDRDRVISRGMQSIRDHVLATDGTAIFSIADKLAAQHNLFDRLVESLSYCGRPHWIRKYARGRRFRIAKAISKGLAVRLLEKDPCEAFFRSGLLASYNKPTETLDGAA